MYLPPYSPDYNPIELAFSKIKRSVQHSGDILQVAMDGNDAENEAEIHANFFCHVYSITEDNAKGWYKHCGYDY
jgi:hypothetical protein